MSLWGGGVQRVLVGGGRLAWQLVAERLVRIDSPALDMML